MIFILLGGGSSNGGAGLFVPEFSQFGTNNINGITGTRGYFCGGGSGGNYNALNLINTATQLRGGIGGGGNGATATDQFAWVTHPQPG